MPEHDHDCRDFLEQVSDYIDGSLDELTCENFKKHLDECEHCQVVINTTKKTIELYHDKNMEIQLPPGVRSRLFHCLELDDYIEDHPE
jgi:anti-sigma factor (TIGR02949 family)